MSTKPKTNILREKRTMDRRIGRAQIALNDLIREARRNGWPVTVELHEPPSGRGTLVHVTLYSPPNTSSSSSADKSSRAVASIIPSSSSNESRAAS